MNENDDVAVAFYFEDLMKNVSSGIPEATIFRWRQNAKAFGVKHLMMIDVTTYKIGQYHQNPDGEVIFERFNDLSEIEKNYPDHELVLLETPNTLEAKNIKYEYLDKFIHPEKAIYVVGGDSGNSDMISGRENKKWVVIPSTFDQPIWSDTAVTIALYDRYIKKIWQSQ